VRTRNRVAILIPVFAGSIAAAGPATSRIWTAEGDKAGAKFGRSAAAAGDVNGDGYGDVSVGAPGYENGQPAEGRTFVYLGSASGLSTTPSWMTESNQPSGEYGESVGMAGDVNGDGYDDLIVGSVLVGASVYHGSATGLSTVSNWTSQPGGWFGASVGAAGDVNGDGYSDVIVGDAIYTSGEWHEGAAFVYHGSPSGLSTTADWTAEGNQFNANLGSVGAAGDVNGDGYDDVIVGAMNYDNGQVDEGRAFVYFGSPSGLSEVPDWTAEGGQEKDGFGGSVGTAGDVNGDGYADVIVGASLHDNGQKNEGRTFVYHGSASGLSSKPSWIAEGGRKRAGFGSSSRTAGDVNGDGYADVIVGAPGYSHGQVSEGAAFVYLGSPSGLSSQPSWRAECDQANAACGISVASGGDVDGDGHDELLVGAFYYDNGQTDEGRVFLYDLLDSSPAPLRSE